MKRMTTERFDLEDLLNTLWEAGKTSGMLSESCNTLEDWQQIITVLTEEYGKKAVLEFDAEVEYSYGDTFERLLSTLNVPRPMTKEELAADDDRQTLAERWKWIRETYPQELSDYGAAAVDKMIENGVLEGPPK